MKKIDQLPYIFSGIIFLLAFFLLPTNGSAHSGNTDRYGGHNCRTGYCVGTYHYHHCGPSCSNGRCPDNHYCPTATTATSPAITTATTTTTTTTTTATTTTRPPATTTKIPSNEPENFYWAFIPILLLVGIIIIIYAVRQDKKNKK